MKDILKKIYGKTNFINFILLGTEYLELFLKIDLTQIKTYVEYLTNILNNLPIINIGIKNKLKQDNNFKNN